jgi:hypothetical protein
MACVPSIRRARAVFAFGRDDPRTTVVNAIKPSEVRALDMNLEVVVIPVSNVDRASSSTAAWGWRLDADFVFDTVSAWFGSRRPDPADQRARNRSWERARAHKRHALRKSREGDSVPMEGRRRPGRPMARLPRVMGRGRPLEVLRRRHPWRCWPNDTVTSIGRLRTPSSMASLMGWRCASRHRRCLPRRDITLLYNSRASRACANVAFPRFFNSIRGKDAECLEISKSQSSTMTSRSELHS